MRIITLIEDSGENDDLVNEFGLCLYIESDGKKILMDTGGSENFIKNSNSLGIDLREVDFLVISHAHSDHSGGIGEFLRINSTADVYLHNDCTGEYFGNIGAKLPLIVSRLVHPLVKKSKLFSKYIGIDKAVLKKYEKRIRFVLKTKELSRNISLISNIPKIYPTPEGNRFLLSQKGNRLQYDDFRHELILTVNESDGVVLFSGCAHSGILNMIAAVRAKFVDLPIKAIVGGFHLKLQPNKNSMAGNIEDVEFIANELSKQKIEKIYTGHCTGAEAYKILKNTLKERIASLYTGQSINL